jgi:hypothetical protein
MVKWLLCEGFVYAWVAQLVEHFPEEEGVAGSIPAPGTKKEKPRVCGAFLFVLLV